MTAAIGKEKDKTNPAIVAGRRSYIARTLEAAGSTGGFSLLYWCLVFSFVRSGTGRASPLLTMQARELQ